MMLVDAFAPLPRPMDVENRWIGCASYLAAHFPLCPSPKGAGMTEPPRGGRVRRPELPYDTPSLVVDIATVAVGAANAALIQHRSLECLNEPWKNGIREPLLR